MEAKNTKTEANFRSSDSKFTDDIISVIIRCHKKERLDFLDEALFSLAIQSWRNIEVVVVIQNGTAEFSEEVSKLIKNQPFFENFKSQIHAVKVAAGVDGRSLLLNHGIKNATGKYLTFLDYDDIVYQHGYETLINQLKEGKGAIAVGGCRMAFLKNEFDAWHVEKKEKPFAWGRNQFDLFKSNFIPIHSYVIDRTRVEADDLFFDNDFLLLEDYDFLLRLAAKYVFDFSKLDVFVCEYRMHGNNTLEFNSTASISDAHSKFLELINKRKEDTLYLLPIARIIDIMSAKATTPTLPESLTSENIPIEINDNPENLRVFKKILDTTEERIYQFFKDYPRIERRLSKVARYGYEIYSERRTRNENKPQLNEQ